MLQAKLDSLAKKRSLRQKITSLTAYDYPTAKLLDESGVDIVLVGDSLGNVVLGYKDPLPVTIADIVHHTKAVRAGITNALLVSDIPLSAFSESSEKALFSIKMIIESGADAVKIEGVEHIGIIKDLLKCGISVMGHIGYTPQTSDAIGGATIKGKTEESCSVLMAQAHELEGAGVFAIVLELVDRDASALITSLSKVPTIGIGSGPFCDGQVLVLHDIIGLYQGKTPKFVKQYCDVSAQIKAAVSQYCDEVRGSLYPS